MLFKRFPWAHNKSSTNTTGISCHCDDGWFCLLWRLLEELEEQYERNNKEINTLSIDDIKEKYGGLRFYVGNAIAGVDDIIQKYEDKSETICEICGEPGSLHVKNEWLKTLCCRCAAERGYTATM